MSSLPVYNRNSFMIRSDFDEDDWVIQIRRNLDQEQEEEEEEKEVAVSIYNVPKLLFYSAPDSYQPQQVAIGPYHYFTPERYEMERYKVSAAKRIQKERQKRNNNNNNNNKFHHLVETIKKYEPRIRAHYHKYLNLNTETLAWMMAVDASFLIEFLRVVTRSCGGTENAGLTIYELAAGGADHYLSWLRSKSTYNAILGDIVMLENQIPLFLLRKVLEFQFSSLELGDELLTFLLMGFVKETSPFKIVEEYYSQQVLSKSAPAHHHLLDVLYHVIVPPRHEGSYDIIDMAEFRQEQLEGGGGGGGEEHSLEKSTHVTKLLDVLWKALSKLDRGPIRKIKKILISKPFGLVSKLPWTIISNFPGVRLLKQPLENLFSSQVKKDENENPEENEVKKRPPLVEEITIPSVTEMTKAGVNFLPTNSGISSISFDVKTATFYLPTIRLDINSEVVLRNLVAYEARHVDASSSGSLVLARYTELMNGIIDTEEDAKFLREKGIILNHLKKDEEVAKLWNEMNRSVKLTKVEFLDKTIADVNRFYSCRWKIKFKKYVKRYVFGSWKFLTFFACLLMLLLMAVQAFCSVYSCPRIFNHVQDFQ